MKKTLTTIFGLFLFLNFSLLVLAANPTNQEEPPRTELTPLMERYILDELKDLRTQIERLRAEMFEKIAQKELGLANTAINYSNNTVTYFFYIITGTGVILALVGYNSLRDIRNQVKNIAEKEMNRLTKEYENRLTKVETDLREEGENIIQNQQDIEKTQKTNFLWWQAELEKDPARKLELYNEISRINPKAAESYVKKAQIYLKTAKYQDALINSTKAIELKEDHSIAFYNRACANAQLGKTAEAIKDLKVAFSLSEPLKENSRQEKLLDPIKKDPGYLELIS